MMMMAAFVKQFIASPPRSPYADKSARPAPHAGRRLEHERRRSSNSESARAQRPLMGAVDVLRCLRVIAPDGLDYRGVICLH
jgi:hypothetical protein